MIKITAITSGRNVPSSRFRVRQFIEPLRSLGIDVAEYTARPSKYVTRRVWPLGLVTRIPALLASGRSDITWLEREMITGKFTAERFASRPCVLDVDDAIWLTNTSGFSEQLAAQCDGVIAGNIVIAEHYRPHARRVWIIPTSVDTLRWRPLDQPGAADGRRGDRWIIGWIGTSSNLPYLYGREEPIRDFLRDHADTELLVISDTPPAFQRIPKTSWRFERWSELAEVDLARQMDVGLMPLPDSEWARGKCALKMLQYMSLGLPVVASPVGTARQIFDQANVGVAAATSQEWYDGLKQLHSNGEWGVQMGAAGRRLVEENYSVEKNVGRLAEVFRGLMRGT